MVRRRMWMRSKSGSGSEGEDDGKKEEVADE
jgi:hypothetical protein